MAAPAAGRALAQTSDMPMYLDLLKSWELRLRDLRIGNLRVHPRRRRKT